MMTGDLPKIAAGVGVLSQFDNIETVRSGNVIMVGGSLGISANTTLLY